MNNKGYTFRFFLESNIRNNEPFSPEFNLIELGDSQVETMLCDYNKRNSGNITINVFDSETDESLDGVQITYTCGGETCIIGTTEDGTLKDRFPVCLGGMITFIKDGYLQTAKLLSTELDQDLTTDNVYLYKFKDIEFDLKKKKVNKETRLRYPRGTIRGWFFNSAPLPLDDNEEALITLTRKGSPGDAEHFAFAEFRGSETTHGNISLVPGLYEVSINLLLDENITIPEDEICYPAGFLGLGEECEDIPEINISAPFPSGGLKFDYEFTEEDLQKDKVTFYAVNPDIAGIEESQRVIEDLEEISKIEEYSARYNSSLRPRFG